MKEAQGLVTLVLLTVLQAHCNVAHNIPLPRRTVLARSSFAVCTAAFSPVPAVDAAEKTLVGGGFDLRGPSLGSSLGSPDVIYPASLLGEWKVQRAVTSVEGDEGQALTAWKCLGGFSKDAFLGKKSEVYLTRFITAPKENQQSFAYEFDGNTITGVVCDRGFETRNRLLLSSRQNEPEVSWSVQDPTHLVYNDDTGGTVTIDVVQRSVELPSDQGFGYNELLRITTPINVMGGMGKVERAVRVRRRFRRSFDANGNRVLEGLEITNTYRVLDGIAGIEMPTSTLRSAFRLTRS